MLNSFLDYFIPKDFYDPDGIAGRRAKIGIAAALLIAIWGPIVAPIAYLSYGSLPALVMTILTSALMFLAPFVFKKTGNLGLMGIL